MSRAPRHALSADDSTHFDRRVGPVARAPAPFRRRLTTAAANGLSPCPSNSIVAQPRARRPSTSTIECASPDFDGKSIRILEYFNFGVLALFLDNPANFNMLSGTSIIRQAIVRNLRSALHQVQPCGVDLTRRCVLKWSSPATVDFDNSRRQFRHIRDFFQRRC